MHNWFRCTVGYERIDENRKTVKVKEDYLVDALSYTEAEARITEEMGPFLRNGEIMTLEIKKFKIAEIFRGDGDRFYKVTADFVTFDEKKGIEKRKPVNYLVAADDFDKARENFQEFMKGTLADFVITGIKEEKRIMDLFEYDGKIRKPEEGDGLQAGE